MRQSGLIVPFFAILVTSSLEIWLAQRENLRAEKARHEEAERSAKQAQRQAMHVAAERVLEAIAPFISLNPFNEDWRPLLRTLRARVVIFQTHVGGDNDVVGVWLAAEGEHGMKLFSEAMLASDGKPFDDESVFDDFDAARTWAGSVMSQLGTWLKDYSASTDVAAWLAEMGEVTQRN